MRKSRVPSAQRPPKSRLSRLMVAEPTDPRRILTSRLYRVNAVLRCVLLAYALVFAIVAVALGDQVMPILGVMTVMAGWSLLSVWWYARAWGLRVAQVVDHAVVVGLLACWHVVASQCPVFAIIPVFWSVAAPVTASVVSGSRVGAVGGIVVGASAVLALPSYEHVTWPLAAFIVMGSVGVGYLTGLMRRALAERERAAADALALGERQRLARVIHDGALQVLALVEREGPSLGPRGDYLAREAREQERALRRLLWQEARDSSAGGLTRRRELTALLDSHSGDVVTVSTMAGEISITEVVAREVDAAVSEALSNVTQHAGPDARVWILLEQVGNEAIISIRDDGVGAEPAAIRSAVERGRMGVRHSIMDRIADIGGSVRLRTAPGKGVEWEFRLPCESEGADHGR